jgi:hypothetical protein
LTMHEWFLNLCELTGTLLRKYPNMELTGILQYTLHQLKVTS